VVDNLRQAWQTLVPPRGSAHGPLPPMLVGLAVVTGLVDAVSYLTLGRVFVANMTGNVVILGFSVAGAQGFSIPASLSALALFAVGSMIGGLVANRAGHRGRIMAVATSIQLVLIVIADVIARPLGAGAEAVGAMRYELIGLLAIAMGLQNAAARRLAVPDLATNVLTTTTTGIFADAKFLGGPGSKFGRRGISVLAIFLGALIGAVLELRVSEWVALVPAGVILAVVAALAWAKGRSNPEWTKATA
jgi:uncharacterized membrane protein YoaK (UPF0700 family)